MLSISQNTSSPSLPRNTFSWLLLILANTLWATTYVTGKFILQDTSVIMLNTLRMCLASLFLIPLLLYKHNKRKAIRLSWYDVPHLLLLSLTAFVINKMLEYGGLTLTTATDVALLISSETVFTAFFAWVLLREHLQLVRILLMFLGMFGVYLIVEHSFIPTIPSGGGKWRVLGDVLVMSALLIEAFSTIRGKSLLVKHSPLLIISAAIVGSTFFWLPLAGWEVFTSGWHPLNTLSWLSLLWMALGATVLAYLAWFQGLQKIDGSVGAVTLLIQPLLGTLLAVVLLHEQLTPITILGGILIVVSVFLLSRKARK